MPIIAIAEKVAPAIHEQAVGRPIKYGDSIRLKHINSGCALHSHEISYSHGGSSGQQQVTAYGGYDSNDFWLVKAQHGMKPDHYVGESVRNLEVIRLEHVNSKRNLHSHYGAPSPVTGQQEVTAFGNNGEGDANDNWQVEVEGGGIWYEKKPVKLRHVDTRLALHSHAGFSDPHFTVGQQEVTCYEGNDDNDFWIFDKSP